LEAEMLDWVVALATALTGAFGFLAFERWRRAQRRALAATPPADETVLKVAEGKSTRLYVDRNLPTGAAAGLVNLTSSTLVLTEARLILATHHGRVLEATAKSPIAFRCVGPRRLVAEGLHPDGKTHVRLEIVVDDPESWVADYHAALGTPGPVQTGAAQ
jgi:hypothetical protein